MTRLGLAIPPRPALRVLQQVIEQTDVLAGRLRERLAALETEPEQEALDLMTIGLERGP